MGNAVSSDVQDATDIAKLSLTNEQYNEMTTKCNATSKQTNKLLIQNTTVEGGQIDQSNESNMLCLIKETLTSSYTDEVKQKLLGTFDSQLKVSGGIPFTGGASSAYKKMYTDIDNNVTNIERNNVYKECLVNSDQMNDLIVKGSTLKNARINQVNKSFMQCVLDSDTVKNKGLKMDLDSERGVKSYAEITGWNPIDDVMSSFTSLAVVSLFSCCSLCMIMVILVILVFIMNKPDSGVPTDLSSLASLI